MPSQHQASASAAASRRLPPARRRERGAGSTEVMVAAGLFSLVATAALGIMSSSLDVAADQQTSSWLFTHEGTALLRVVEDIEDADPYDAYFLVEPDTLQLREVTGATESGARTYGDTIVFTFEGPVDGVGARPTWSLVRSVYDPLGALLRRQVIASGLTGPNDADTPSRFELAAPHVTVQLVSEAQARARAEDVVVGAREQVRLRY